MPRRKDGDDDLIERQREREHAAREQRRTDLREQHVTEGLQAVGAEVHRRFDPARRDTSQARDDVVVDDDVRVSHNAWHKFVLCVSIAILNKDVFSLDITSIA